MTVLIEVVREDWADPQVPLPAYASTGAAGADLRASFPDPDPQADPDAGPPPTPGARGRWLAPGARMLVPTGLRVAIPEGYEMQIRPRSGLALTHGITLPNAPGTIDWDYRGPLGVILANTGAAPFFIAHGSRIAQAVLAPVLRARFDPVAQLDGTDRGAGGFGSTGVD